MRVLFLGFLTCALVAGCASPSLPPKPSPYHYGAAVNTALADPHRASTPGTSHGH